MLDQRTLRLLKSSRPEEREQAIKALAQSKDPSALPYLADIYRNDPDESLRELARKAGVYIKKNSGSDSPAPLPNVPRAEDLYGGHDDIVLPVSDDLAPKPKGKEKVVSEAKRLQARGFLEQGLEASLAGEQKRAYQLLQKAVKLNPNLAADAYSRSAISSITGLPHERAMEQLSAGRLAGSVAKNPDDITWSDAFVDLAIYWVINFGIYLIGTMIGLAVLQAVINAVPDPVEQANLSQQFAAITGTITIVLAMTQGAIQATVAVVALLVLYFIWHMVATGMLGGEGNFTKLIRKCTLLLALYGPVATLVLIGTFILLPIVSPETMSSWYSLLVFGIGLGGVLLLSQRIGATYEFGIGRGCATIVLSYILVACLTFSVFYIMLSSAANSLSFIMGGAW